MSRIVRRSFARLEGRGPRGTGAAGIVDGKPRARRRGLAAAREEAGSVLILALVYLVVISMTVGALATWATNDLNNTSKFSSAQSLQFAAGSMTQVAIQYMRYNPLLPPGWPSPTPSPLTACWGNDSISKLPVIDGSQIAVWCSTVWNPLLSTTRVVTFNACLSSVSAAACHANTLLTSVVTYDDYPPGNNAPIQTLCKVWCGQGMTVNQWIWGTTTSGSVTGVAATMAFSTEPSDTTVGVATSAAVVVKDSSGTPVAGDLVTIAVASGGTLDPVESTLSATTNPSGVATFTSLVPQDAVNYILVAHDGSVSAQSTSFTVGKGANAINVTSSPPNATVGGSTYTPTAVATSGDSVSVSSGSTGVCTVSSGVVSFVGMGTCKLNFNDPGNANYVAASQTQSFSVAAGAPTQVVITPNPGSTSTSSKTNLALTLQLEDQAGDATTSTGTITLKLTSSGNGFFSSSNNANPITPFYVTFANGIGTATAYFGDNSAQTVTVTALNGASPWGTTSLTAKVSGPTQVQITLNPNSPSTSWSTNTTVSLQLEDSNGNPVNATSTITLVLSDTGDGFFYTSKYHQGGWSQISVTFSSGQGTGTVYFGDQRNEYDTITATNGGVSWGSVSFWVGGD